MDFQLVDPIRYDLKSQFNWCAATLLSYTTVNNDLWLANNLKSEVKLVTRVGAELNNL